MRYFECQKCKGIWSEKELIDLDVWGKFGVECGDHECGGVVKVPGTMSRIGGEGSDRQISSMQQSFRQRFMKKGIDDVKHKFPEFEDSLRGGEAARIKKKLGDQ